MTDFLLRLFRLKQFPPILMPVVIILYVIMFPFYSSKPVIKWLIGRWSCTQCGREYGSKDERREIYFYESVMYKCEACDTMDKLTT